MDQVLTELLNELGYTTRQGKVYLALLKFGTLSAIQIGRETGLKHPTVYDALELLKSRGLVTEISRNGRRAFVAESPVNLRRAEEKRRSALHVALPQLLALYSGGDKRSGIRCYTGDEVQKVLYQQLLGAQNHEYFYFGQVSAMLNRSSEAQELAYLHERLARQVVSHSIRLRESVPEPEYMSDKPEYLRRVRYISGPDGDSLPELYLVDNRVLIRSGVSGDQLLVIESPDLYRLIRALWDIVWQNAQP